MQVTTLIDASTKQPLPEAFFLDGGDTGILLLHGFTSSPYELDPLARFLHAHGYTIEVPLLEGHGTTPEHLERTTYHDWVQSAKEGYLKLAKRCKQVYIAGFSMGGALALHLAAHFPSAGVITLCAPIFVQDWRAPYAKFVHRFMRFLHHTNERPAEIRQYLLGYNRTPIRSVASLMQFLRIVKKDVRRVQVPALVLQSERDETVQPKSGQYIYDHLGAKQKSLKWFPKSGHILPCDVEKEQVFAEILSFLKATS